MNPASTATRPARAPIEWHVIEPVRPALKNRGPAYHAFCLLRVGFALLPIAVGVDKFLNLLTTWEKYLSPLLLKPLGAAAFLFIWSIGVFEIGAGVVVAMRPRLGGLVVAFWLWGIMINLLLMPGFFDIAIRDFGLSLGALALSLLGVAFEESK